MNRYCTGHDGPTLVLDDGRRLNMQPLVENGVCSECKRPKQCARCGGNRADEAHTTFEVTLTAAMRNDSRFCPHVE